MKIGEVVLVASVINVLLYSAMEICLVILVHNLIEIAHVKS